MKAKTKQATKARVVGSDGEIMGPTQEHQAWDGGSLVPLPTPQSVQEGLAGVQGAVDSACQLADAISVTDEATRDAATAGLTVMKRCEDRIQERRKALSGPFDKWAKAINVPFNRLLVQLQDSRRRLSGEWSVWTEGEARRRDLELEKQREKERRQETKAIHKAHQMGVDPMTVMKPAAPAPPPIATHVRASTGGSVTGKKQPTYRVIDKEEVPDHLKDISHGRTLAAIRALGPDAAKDAIPGLEIAWSYGASIRGG